MLTPYETLLQGVRRMRPAVEDDEGGEDVEDLLATFERAVAALGRARERTAEDDIAVLERTLTANLESGLLLLDREGRILALNPVGAALLGVEPPEAGTPLVDLLPPGDGGGALSELLLTAVAEGRAIPRREVPWERGGERRTLGLTAHLLRRDDGGVRGFLVLFADLTEIQRRADEERLAESLAQLGELAGGMAHELRNSLATLRGYLTLIEREPEEETIADYLGEIRHETDHLQRVLEDFLAFARPGSVRPEPLQLETIVRRAAADPVLGGVGFTFQMEPALPTLRGDPQLLERAVRNLLHNAAKAQGETGAAGPVEVALEHAGEGVRLSIADRGPGVPPEMEGRLFQPFATGFREGVGLGLALTYRIVALHRGRLELQPREGGGTRAVVVLDAGTIVTKGSGSSV
jgi:two-component system sensor histidine kinase PilS (NtrC family)